RHRPLLAGLDQAGEHLLAVEALAPSVLLHHEMGDLVDALVGGEPLAAGEAFPPAADHLPLLALARVHHLVFHVSAEGTLHLGLVGPRAPMRGPPGAAPPGGSPAMSAPFPMASPSRRSRASPRTSPGRFVRAWQAMPAAAAVCLSTAKAWVRARR